jgi:hypothetical protein
MSAAESISRALQSHTNAIQTLCGMVDRQEKRLAAMEIVVLQMQMDAKVRELKSAPPLSK